MSNIIVIALSVASRLHFQNFGESRVSKPEKPEFVKIDRFRYFLLTVAVYYVITISKSIGRSEKPISGIRIIPEHRLSVEPQVKNNTTLKFTLTLQKS